MDMPGGIRLTVYQPVFQRCVRSSLRMRSGERVLTVLRDGGALRQLARLLAVVYAAAYAAWQATVFRLAGAKLDNRLSLVIQFI